MNDGAGGVELDVRLARDGVPVVIHDSTLRRTGLCEGVVAEMTSAELGKTAVGAWFNQAYPRLARVEYAQQFLPTLDQVFAFFSKRSAQLDGTGAVIYVELKTDDAEDSSDDLAGSVVRLINDHSLQSRTVVVSFDLNAVAQIKQFDSSIRTGALFEPKRAVRLIHKQQLIKAAVDCGVDEILLHRLIATRRLVGLAAESGLRSVVWTVDDPKWMRRAANLGIHSLITNHPAEMVRANRRVE